MNLNFLKNPLLKSANDDNPEVRLKTAASLADNFHAHEKNKRCELLKKFINDPHPAVRMKSVEIVDKNFPDIDNATRNEIIMQSLGDNYFNVRKNAVKLVDNNIKHIDPGMLKILLKKFENDESASVRTEFVRLIDNHFSLFFNANAEYELLKKFCDDETDDVKIETCKLIVNHFNDFKNDSEKANIEIVVRRLISKKNPGIIKELRKIKDEFSYGLQEIIGKFQYKKPKKEKKFEVIPGDNNNNNNNNHNHNHNHNHHPLPGDNDLEHFTTIINNSKISAYTKRILVRLIRVNMKLGEVIAASLSSDAVAVSKTPLTTLLKKLADDNYSPAKLVAASLINKNFYVILPDVRENLLRKLLIDPENAVRKTAISIIVKNFKDTTVLQKRELLGKPDAEISVNDYLLRLLNRNFSKILENVDCELLIYLAEDIDQNECEKFILDLIKLKFNTFPGDAKSETINLLADKTPGSKAAAADLISKNFDLIPRKIRERILLKLVADENGEVKKHALNALCCNLNNRGYSRISEKLFNLWLRYLVISEDPVDRSNAAYVITKQWSVIGDEFKCDFDGLAQDKSSHVRQHAVLAMNKNFNSLMINDKGDIIKKLACDNNPGVRADTAMLIAKKYKNLLPETQKCLSNLAEDEDPGVRSSTTRAIVKYYDHLPWDVCEKLKK